jgi:polysaccharide biosynthesis/export protein
MHRLVVAIVLVLACGSPRPPSYPVHRDATTSATGPIQVIGHVHRPGAIAYRPGIRLVQAIVEAGGFTQLAWRGHVKLRWTIDGKVQAAIVNVNAILESGAPDPELLPGDIVFVDARYM